jgi:hypothetical protein
MSIYTKTKCIKSKTEELCNITHEHLQSRQEKKDLNRNIYVIQESPTFDSKSKTVILHMNIYKADK